MPSVNDWLQYTGNEDKQLKNGADYQVMNKWDNGSISLKFNDRLTVEIKPSRFDQFLLRKTVKDNVNSPAHYTTGNIETIDIIEQTVAELPSNRAYQLGNVIKYVSRHSRKNGKEDLEKAAWYLNRAIEQYQADAK